LSSQWLHIKFRCTSTAHQSVHQAHRRYHDTASH
jgi:hypothetical protein